MSFAAVISDFDGVLADSTAAIARVWARWGERLGIDGAAIQAANHGRPSEAVIAEHVPADRVAAEQAWVLEAETADTGGVVAYPARPTCSRCPSSPSPRRASGSLPTRGSPRPG